MDLVTVATLARRPPEANIVETVTSPKPKFIAKRKILGEKISPTKPTVFQATCFF
jgi:hypothetical protein